MFRLRISHSSVSASSVRFRSNDATKTATLSDIPLATPSGNAISGDADKKHSTILIETATIPPATSVPAPHDSFADIPGPTIFNYLSKAFHKVPIIKASTLQYAVATTSQVSWYSNMWLFNKMFNDYGPMVRIRGPPNGDVVLLGRKELIEDAFKSEASFPIRSGLQTLEHFRLNCRLHKGKMLVLPVELTKNNSDESLLEPIKRSHVDISAITENLVSLINETRNKRLEVENLRGLLYKWSMECLFNVATGRRLGFLNSCGLSSTSDAGILLSSLLEATKAMQVCEKWNMHQWKMIRWPVWDSFVKHCDNIDWMIGIHIQKALTAFRETSTTRSLKRTAAQIGLSTSINSPNPSIIDRLILNKNNLTIEDILTIMLDLMLVGVNVSVQLAMFTLYYLAKSPRCQNKIADMRSDNLPYLRACIRETLRLRAPFPIYGRLLAQDACVNNYHIPRNTFLLMVTNLDNVNEDFYDDPQKFKPERWLDKLSSNNNLELFDSGSLPLSQANMSNCVQKCAKELLDIQCTMLINKILEKFRIEYNYGSVSSANTFLAEPNRPVKLKFVTRK